MLIDKEIDIVVGNVEAQSTIYFNDGSGRNFTTAHFADNKGAVYGFDIADFDRDDYSICPWHAQMRST